MRSVRAQISNRANEGARFLAKIPSMLSLSSRVPSPAWLMKRIRYGAVYWHRLLVY